MTQQELERLTRDYLAVSFEEIEERLALNWTPGGLEIYSSQLNERCHELSYALSVADVSSALPHARAMAPQADERFHRKLARRLIEVQLSTAAAEIKAISGEPLSRPMDLASVSALAPSEPPQVTATVSEISAMYHEERVSRGKWTARTAEQGLKIFSVVAELLGNKPIGDVTKEDVRRLGLDVAKLPANMSKLYPGLTPAEVLARTADDDSVARLEPRSVNKYYQHVRTLFAWAVEHDHIAQSPASILRNVEEGRAQDARKALDDADIKALFDHVALKAREPYGHWIPRILAYTGCRLGEAAQLRTIDVRQVQGVWVFDFNRETEQKDRKNIKTDGGVRQVPIHPRLIELGLIEFVESVKEDFLFPERMRYTEDETRSNTDLLSKQLNRWLRNAGVNDPKKQVQSFRGTVATRLKELGTPDYQIAEILGHENDNITTGRYGKRTNLTILSNVLATLTLPV
ncbi:Site-specific recombinase XerD [Dyella jiangningensis]|uniref:site-specific integrase n=1 Tax=Dyella sp. AtDHG13 TaxID=1938897 RepID=UPI000891C36C|nr:site-specific integrase [Dyella sp. AtDHG13]PXV55444.1 site-specific recombinase XerD [Dyella sp. AtDHG13]SDK76291.1 Site-specific recombinase XerD [Dyella jiangningensis]